MLGKRLNLLALLAGVLVLLAACTGPITAPDQFTFNDVPDADPGEVVTSNVVTITGINTASPAKVTTGGTLLIDGEAAGDDATVNAGAKLAVRVTASERFGGEVAVTVDVGGVTDTFTVTTREATPPADFEFDPVTDAELGAVVTSAPFTVSGLEAPSLASVSGEGSPQLILNGDESAIGFTHPVENGDELQVRLTASSEFGATTTAVIEIGGAEGAFSVTTRSASTAPEGFEFAPQSGVELDEVALSNTVTISGLEAPAMLSVAGEGSPELLVNGAVEASPVEVDNDDEVQIRLTASGEHDTAVTATATLGNETADFVVTTRAAQQPVVTLTAPVGLTEAEPGQSVTLSWTVTGDYDEVTLTATHGLSEDVTGAFTANVTIPGNVADTNYTLTATYSRSDLVGTASTSTIAIPLWVCEDPDAVITIESTELRESFYALSGTPSSGPITCFDAQQVTDWDTPHYDDDTAGTIATLVGMQHFVDLETFKATYNEISDLTPLAGLHNLEELNLDKNRITDISPLAGLQALRILELWDNGPVRDDHSDGITDIGALALIPTLEELYLSENPISDLTPLASLPSLRVLFLIAADVEDISPLGGLTSLQVLRLSGNRIEDGAALADLENLAWLELEENFLQDNALVPLEEFENLFVARLDGNFFTDFTPLIENEYFPALEGAPDLPSHRQQPTEPLITIGWNCMTDAVQSATITALEAKSALLTVDSAGGTQREEADCQDFLEGASVDRSEMHRESIRMLRENNRIR